DLMHLPVHRRGTIIKDLHPIHSDISCASFGIARVHIGKGDEPAAVLRPAFEDGKITQRDPIRCWMFLIKHRGSSIQYLDNVLTRSVFYMFGTRMQQMDSLFQKREAFPQISR